MLRRCKPSFFVLVASIALLATFGVATTTASPVFAHSLGQAETVHTTMVRPNVSTGICSDATYVEAYYNSGNSCEEFWTDGWWYGDLSYLTKVWSGNYTVAVYYMDYATGHSHCWNVSPRQNQLFNPYAELYALHLGGTC